MLSVRFHSNFVAHLTWFQCHKARTVEIRRTKDGSGSHTIWNERAKASPWKYGVPGRGTGVCEHLQLVVGVVGCFAQGLQQVGSVVGVNAPQRPFPDALKKEAFCIPFCKLEMEIFMAESRLSTSTLSVHSESFKVPMDTDQLSSCHSQSFCPINANCTTANKNENVTNQSCPITTSKCEKALNQLNRGLWCVKPWRNFFSACLIFVRQF